MYNRRDNCIEALILYNYLVTYTEFENLIKKEFIYNFETLSEDYKNRTYFYLGAVGSLNIHIEYDTYSLVKETSKYNKSKLLNHLTMNQIIKLERKEQAIVKFRQNIASIQIPKVEFTFCDCCLKLVNTRNKMAHEIFNLNIKDKDIIEIISKPKMEQLKPNWLNEFEYEELDDNMLGILSNYIYMNRMKEKLNEI